MQWGALNNQSSSDKNMSSLLQTAQKPCQYTFTPEYGR